MSKTCGKNMFTSKIFYQLNPNKSTYHYFTDDGLKDSWNNDNCYPER